MGSYREFLSQKRPIFRSVGVQVDEIELNPALFPFQRRLVSWALRKGRAAIFATTGMGKTPMQLEWARRAADRALVLAPLAVARQTVAEGRKFGVEVTYARRQAEAPAAGITVANYEMLPHFDPDAFGAVVLDESGILKNFSGVTKKRLVEAFRRVPMRLCCTATPAPNDTVELCNHADFLGVMGPSEMISTFFTPKGEGVGQAGHFRLKNYARDDFFRWLASWSMSLTRPSDLGFSDDGFELPPLDIRVAEVEVDWRPPGHLFFTHLKGVTQRAQARRATHEARVAAAVELVRAEAEESWLVWCGLNAESEAAARSLPGAVEVRGPDSPDAKAEKLARFADGLERILVTKPTIAGYGLNFQVCARQVFVGIGDSYETYFQAVRRSWRFGQTRPVVAHVVLSSAERAVYDNVLRKEREAAELMAELVRHVAEFERAELDRAADDGDTYAPRRPMALPPWLARPLEVAS